MVHFIDCSSQWLRLQGCAARLRQQNICAFSTLHMTLQDVHYDVRRYMYARIIHSLPIYRNPWKSYCNGVYRMDHMQICSNMRKYAACWGGCCQRVKFMLKTATPVEEHFFSTMRLDAELLF